MSAALTAFREAWLAPDLASVSDANVELAVTSAALRVDSATFGARYTEALARIAAHDLTLAARAQAVSVGSAGVGAVTSIGTGNLSIAFGGPQSASRAVGDDYYRQTHHGLAYLQIRNSRAEVGFGLIS